MDIRDIRLNLPKVQKKRIKVKLKYKGKFPMPKIEHEEMEHEETVFEMIERLKLELEFALKPEVFYIKGDPVAMAEEAIISMETRIKQSGFIVEMIEEKLNAQQGVQAEQG